MDQKAKDEVVGLVLEALARASTSPSIEPVTLGGRYECEDGTVADFEWRAGMLIEVARVASWRDVPSKK